jgi:hypothetical protein
MLGIGSRTAAQAAEEIRNAERRLAKAERAAADLEKSHQERIGAALADGNDGGDIDRAAQEITAAHLKASALRRAIETLHVRLRRAIEQEQADRRAEAERELQKLADAKRKMKSDFIPVAAKLVKAVGEAHGHAAAWRAAWTLRQLGDGRCEVPQMGVRDSFRTSDDPLSRALLGAVEDAQKSPDALTRESAARGVLTPMIPFDIERRVRELLPPPPVEQPPAKPRQLEPEEKHLQTWKIEPSLKNPCDEGVVKFG